MFHLLKLQSNPKPKPLSVVQTLHAFYLLKKQTNKHKTFLAISLLQNIEYIVYCSLLKYVVQDGKIIAGGVRKLLRSDYNDES